MNLVRAFFLRHRALAIVLVLATLCMKAIVPTGFMIGQNSKVLTVQICDDAFGNHAVKQIAIPMKDGSSDSSGKQGKSECPFSSLSMASMSGADPALLALALAFILALGFVSTRTAHPERVFHLRPPLRGPPALA
ncbi:DUF2946 family protein [Novosphingobium piscinae]|uniref:DUF2946 domain-containing protein n=1 Tax=Novosphingobium piscinae TaxID=1507448 RepID=A0A7X1FY78_9SPHN|nr:MULTISPECIES: DUF2946 family protein [Novosphingobium]MBC2669216.1 hypothetical protein [Novosphingobium piscinae]NLR39285.1 hypothetical protein [Novosphingobium sp. ERW19]